MAKRSTRDIDFPFYQYLWFYYRENRKAIRGAYKQLTQKFLDFNDPQNATAFLRPPQFEALEMYVFLKEYCDNRFLAAVFRDWYERTGRFEGRATAGISPKGQGMLFGPAEFDSEDPAKFQAVFSQLERIQQVYPNYIFALTMGLGKTVLMATSIFYEFLLANKYPKDERFCHNALVFAPDKTVLQSLREIQTFDKSRVVPPEYVNWLDTNLRFHFLEESGSSLNTLDKSRFNIIISNTQKIILKKQHKARKAAELLFQGETALYKAKTLNQQYADLYGDLEAEVESEEELIPNQRFAKLLRLERLGIYVDEAHHLFGNALAADLGGSDKRSSLRLTIDEIAYNLKKAGTTVVGCYNYTGTPYANNRVLPEVVYAYGLKNAVDNGYLKKPKLESIRNVREDTLTFVRIAVTEFWDRHRNQRYEGLLPKMAFFASSIEELQSELRPAVEQVLAELDIPIGKILVNVGDDAITTNDDLREFKMLDAPASEKQFILLVNKGKEGWNCRSLFGVAMHREPKSRIFVLQATMRCLRSITEVQQTGHVFLSAECAAILESELQENFRVSIADLSDDSDGKVNYQIKVVPPPVTIHLKRIRKLYNLQEKAIRPGASLDLDHADTERYRVEGIEINLSDLSAKRGTEKDYTELREKRAWSELTLVAEVARYLNRSPLQVRGILESTAEGLPRILEAVNEHNQLLHDWVIPRLFKLLYDIQEYERLDDDQVMLVKEPPADPGYYSVRANPLLTLSAEEPDMQLFREKSFHLDHYCFDSEPERKFFLHLLHDGRVDHIWFTGMLTHGQSDFRIEYIDPVSHTLRSYYPDFVLLLKDGSYVIVEVKGENLIDDEVTRAKAQFAEALAGASAMRYVLAPSKKAAEARDAVGVVFG